MIGRIPGTFGAVASYDAFISYSHGADARLAPALHHALHRFAKPWYRARAVRVFRDETNLALAHNLPETLTAALDGAAHFLLMASPRAAQSKWVQAEAAHWVARKGAERILIVLTEGEIRWDEAAGDFDWTRTDALPEVLKGAFGAEPLYLDLRWTKSAENFSARDPRFLDAVARISAILRGMSLDAIAGEDVRQHRRTRRIAAVAVASIAAFAVAAGAGGLYAWHQRQEAVAARDAEAEQRRIADERRGEAERQRAEAERRRNEALASQSRFLAEAAQALAGRGDFEQAALVLLEALPRRSGDGTTRPLVPEAAAAMRRVLAGDPLRLDLRGHDGAVLELVPLGDGQPIASRGAEGTVRLWDPKSGHEIFRLNGRDRIALSADGRLAFVLDGWDVEVWSLTERRRIRTLEKVEDGVDAICVSPDGGHLVAWTATGEASVWNTETAAKVASFSGGTGTMQRRCLFSADGRRIASVWLEGFRVWDVARGESVGAHAGSNFGQHALLDRDGRRLVTSRNFGAEIDVWDVESGRRVAELTGHALGITALTLDRTGTRLASGAQDNTVRIWNLARAQPLALLQGHESPILHAAFSSDGTRLATAGQDRSARFWDAATGRPLASYAGHDGPVTFVAIAGGPPRLVSGTATGIVRSWDREPATEDGPDIARAVWTLPKTPRAALSPDGRLLVSAEIGGPPRIRDAATLADRATLEGGPRTFVEPRWSPRGTFVAGLERDGAVLLWRAETGALLATLRLPAGYAPARAAFDPAEEMVLLLGSKQTGGSHVAVFAVPGARLLAQHSIEAAQSVTTVDFLERTPVFVTADLASGLRLRSALDGSVIGSFPGEGSRAFVAWLARDGRRLVSIAAEGVRVWDVARGTKLVSFGLGSGELVVFSQIGALSRDGRYLATHALDNAPRVWDLATGGLVATLRGHAALTQTIAFSPDSSLVATAASDGRVIVWQTATGARVAAISGPLSFPLDVAWSDEPGRLLRVAATQGTATLFAIGLYTGELALDLALLEWRTARGLSAVERKRFGLDAPETPAHAPPSCASLAGHPLDPRTRGEPAVAVIADPAAAVALCEAAVKAAPDDPRQRYRLARALLFAERAQEAADLLRHPSLAEYPRALDLLATLLAAGTGMPRDVRRAQALFEKAHALGDLQAACALAGLLRPTEAAAQGKRARALLDEAVARASPCAHGALALLHVSGQPDAPSAGAALYHAVMAAELWQRAGFADQAARARAVRANLARGVSPTDARAAWARIAAERRP
jgi:WD40 repeat protein